MIRDVESKPGRTDLRGPRTGLGAIAPQVRKLHLRASILEPAFMRPHSVRLPPPELARSALASLGGLTTRASSDFPSPDAARCGVESRSTALDDSGAVPDADLGSPPKRPVSLVLDSRNIHSRPRRRPAPRRSRGLFMLHRSPIRRPLPPGFLSQRTPTGSVQPARSACLRLDPAVSNRTTQPAPFRGPSRQEAFVCEES